MLYDIIGALATPFAWIFAIAILLSGVGHIRMMIVSRRYFPCGITAFLLLPVSGYLSLDLM